MSKAQTTVRLVLSAGLLYGVYGETGVFTTIAMGLLLVGAEAKAWVNRNE